MCTQSQNCRGHRVDSGLEQEPNASPSMYTCGWNIAFLMCQGVLSSLPWVLYLSTGKDHRTVCVGRGPIKGWRRATCTQAESQF